MSDTLRQFSKIHIDEDCHTLTGRHSNELFFNCKFKDLRGLQLENCDLNRSTFETESIREALGFTLSLDCNSFRAVEYSPLLFDLMLCLLSMGNGNDEKREKLKEVVGEGRYEALMKVLSRVE